MSFETIGKKVDEIPVKVSYRIIELFSAGLYSSPNKAFEELVSNSYDAGATKVCVRVDIQEKLSKSLLWVCDNGEGMDMDGLKQFWKMVFQQNLESRRRCSSTIVWPLENSVSANLLPIS